MSETPQNPLSSASASAPVPRRSLRQFPFLREAVAAGLLVIAFLVSAKFAPSFLDRDYLFDATSLYVEAALLALPMTFIIISGNIDISVASTLALTACATATLNDRLHFAMPLAMLCGLLLGGLLGFFNGFLIAKWRLPSLAVTLGTYALYRGMAQILLGDQSVSRFPEWFAGVDYRRVIGPVPVPLTIFLILALLSGLLLHRTVFGRWTFAVGVNREASRYSGVPVPFVLISLFTLSGLTAALGGMLMTSRMSAARFDMAPGLELDAITAVVLGGTDIFGGRGTMLGTLIALGLLFVLRTGMGLANVTAEGQMVVIGGLLLAAILFSNLLQRGGRR